MAVAAVSTRYGGVRMRSRLEAQWAAFFDLCGWRWRYEPVKLDGWIPDFELDTPNGSMLVEIKPICWLGTWESWQREMEHPKIQKALRFPQAPVLVLGVNPGGLEWSLAAYPSVGLIVYAHTLAAANVEYAEDSEQWTLVQGAFGEPNRRAPPWREVEAQWQKTLAFTRSVVAPKA